MTTQRATAANARVEGRAYPWRLLPGAYSPVNTDTERQSAACAVFTGGLDTPFLLRPIQAVIDPAAMHTLPIPNHRAIVQYDGQTEASARTVAVVGSDYRVVQNVDLAEWIDRAFPDRPIDTVAPFGGGSGILFAIYLGGNLIAQDDVSEHLLIEEKRGGDRSLSATWIATRLKCLNGLTVRAGGWSVRIRHSATVGDQTQAILGLAAKVNQLRAFGLGDLEHLTHYPLSGADTTALLDAIYPEPRVPRLVALHRQTDGAALSPAITDTLRQAEERWQHDRDQAASHREGSRTAYERLNDENPAYARTAWHLHTAVAEYEQHLRPGRSRASIAASSLLGERADTLVRSFNAIHALVGTGHTRTREPREEVAA